MEPAVPSTPARSDGAGRADAWPPSDRISGSAASQAALEVAQDRPLGDSQSRPASASAGAVPSGQAEFSFSDLLPDVQVPERDRRREQRLVEAARRGESSAVEALYRGNYDTVYRYVLMRIGSASAAEDVTSQVFLGMVRGISGYRDRGKPFVAWLYGIAQKQVAMYYRGRSRSPVNVDIEAAAELAAQSAGPHATVEQQELRAGLARALARVPESQREVLMLRYLLSLSVAETAAVVGRTEGAVKQLQLRGLAALRDILGTEVH